MTLTNKAAGKFLTWILGKDSTAIATWATIGLGWVFYQYVYKPERDEDRRAQVQVAAENARGMDRVATAMREEGEKDRAVYVEDQRRDDARYDQLFNRAFAFPDSPPVASTGYEFDCDP